MKERRRIWQNRC